MTSLDFDKKSQKEVVDKCFTKSESSSKNVIDTMCQFYESKHSKKTEYDGMVENLKYDRPLTSKIRRRNYKVIGKESLSSIKNYRY